MKKMAFLACLLLLPSLAWGQGFRTLTLFDGSATATGQSEWVFFGERDWENARRS